MKKNINRECVPTSSKYFNRILKLFVMKREKKRWAHSQWMIVLCGQCSKLYGNTKIFMKGILPIARNILYYSSCCMRLFLFGNKISIKIDEYLNMCWFGAPLMKCHSLYQTHTLIRFCTALRCVACIKCNSIESTQSSRCVFIYLTLHLHS